MTTEETLLSIGLGLGLSAACGLRVFVPMLAMSLAARTGHLSLASGFEWLGSTTAVIVLAIATVLEVGAYFIAWLDNLLDSVASPAAVVAGTVLTAAMVHDFSPVLQWSLAAIAGGGAAGVIQSSTVVLRGLSSVTTGGLANWLVSTLELVSAVVLSVLALLLPWLAALLVILLLAFCVRVLYRKFCRRKAVVG